MSFNHKLGGRQTFFELVSANYFQVLGVELALGTCFGREDDGARGAGTSAVLSHHTWERLGGDAGIVGRSITMDQTPFTVVGITAPPFEGAGERLRKHFWLPLSAWPRLAESKQPERPRNVGVVGRLAPGVTALQAQAELQVLSARFRDDHHITVEAIKVRSTDAYSQSPPSAQAQALLFTLLLAVTFLTLVACANVANLMLARGHARRGELAVRISLGATRARLVRRLLLEALLLSFAAGFVGVAITTVLPGHLMADVRSMSELFLLDFELDRRVFAWALGASLLACAVFGVAPALQCTRLSVSQVLKDAHGLSVPALKTSLPSMQALVSTLALAVAGMVLRSGPYAHARAVARSLEGVVVVRPLFPQGYDTARQRALSQALFERLEAEAGPRAAAAASGDPLSGEPGNSRTLAVTTGYFEVLGIPILAGRNFQRSDAPERVVIVNGPFAQRHWPGESALGKTVSSSMNAGLAGRDVVAVVRDGSPAAGDPVAYVPAAAEEMGVFLVREGARRIKNRAPGMLAALDPSLQAEVSTGTAWIARAAPGSALMARLVGEFGVLTLVLATFGLFSLSEYTVRRRTREIGILTALGARPRHVLRAIFGPATRALASGVLWGTSGAACVGFVMKRWQLPAGVDPVDVVNYSTVALVLVIAGLIAAYAPARHAMRIQPSEALRYE
jgi:predicted permease